MGKAGSEKLVDIEIDQFDNDQEQSLRNSAGLLFRKIIAAGKNGKNASLRDAVWPVLSAKGLKSSERPRLIVVPLSRLGASAGKSKTIVSAAYFVASKTKVWPSQPMIVKLAIPDEATNDDPCSREYQDADLLKPYMNCTPGEFAVPLVCHGATRDRRYSVLWSPFASSQYAWKQHKAGRQGRLNLRVDDLWRRLTATTEDCGDEERILKTVFDLLTPLHHRGGSAARERLNYRDEYLWYLRGLRSDPPWAQRWRACWGPESQEKAHDFGREWTNPFWVLSKVLDRSEEMYRGCVHGDLHPKNIVISHNGAPRIIDFGWARDRAHIAKDFVLIECNLRFVTLSASVPFEPLEAFCQWLRFDENPPDDMPAGLRLRIELISHLREAARTVFPAETDWNNEYLIPMFIVALGLLKYSEEAESPLSARLHVLCLAEKIAAQYLTR